MDTILTTLNETLNDLRSDVETHKSIVEDAREYVTRAKADLDEAQEELNTVMAAEKTKREEHDNWLRFCNGEPNRGTPAMHVKLNQLSKEANALTNLLAPARVKVNQKRQKSEHAIGALAFNEERLKNKDRECSAMEERLRQLAGEN